MVVRLAINQTVAGSTAAALAVRILTRLWPSGPGTTLPGWTGGFDSRQALFGGLLSPPGQLDSGFSNLLGFRGAARSARRAHLAEVAGSNPAGTTRSRPPSPS